MSLAQLSSPLRFIKIPICQTFTTIQKTARRPCLLVTKCQKMCYSLGQEEKRQSECSIYILRTAADILNDCYSCNRRLTDPLVHSGRHFGRSIHALCNIYALVNNGIIRMGERSEDPEEEFTAQ